MTREQAIEDIKQRGKKIDQLLKNRMAQLGLKDRALNRRTLYRDTNVFVDFVQGFNLNDETKLHTILKKITIAYPQHGLFYERGDAPKTRHGKPIRHTKRQEKPLFGRVLPHQIDLLKKEIGALYGVQVAEKIKINIPGIYSTSKNKTVNG